MKLQVRQSTLQGQVAIPTSKSHTIRAVAIASLAPGDSCIRRPLESSDAASAVACYRLLGAVIDTTDPACWHVHGTGGRLADPGRTIDVGNSGTTLRVALGSAALGPAGREVTFTGDAQIRTRPIGPLLEALENLGADCRSLQDNGKAPVAMCGGLQGGRTDLMAPTSQYLSSLLLCCPLAPRDSDITVTLLNEAGYVQMTLDWLDAQGIRYENEGFDRLYIPGGQTYRPFDRAIPGDFSSATFFLCAAALRGGRVTLTGLDLADSQPDKAVLDYLRAMGATLTVSDAGVTVHGSRLRGTEIDMNATPDALPALAVTAALAEGTTRLVNVPQARNKETDRIRCMATELTRLGAQVEELPDGLIIKGGRLTAGPVRGHADHRIVMALALAGLGADGPLVIDTAEAMAITFPNFVELMQSLGADMTLLPEA